MATHVFEGKAFTRSLAMIGYDKIPWNFGLVLAMTFEEGIGGDVAYDRSRCGHQMTLHNTPTWLQEASGLTVLYLDQTLPEWLDASAADTNISLNFTTQDFSIGAWINVDDLSANRMILCRGLLDADGYHCAILMDGTIVLYTSQAAAGGQNQSSYSAAGEIVTGIWYFVGFTRCDAVVNVYKNGLDVTNTHGIHVDPDASARELHIGIYDDEIGSPFAGMMWNPRVWRNVVVPDYHWQEMFELERGLFGV